jgi:FlaA1/EpsC-like NDP-sugar epimerase
VSHPKIGAVILGVATLGLGYLEFSISSSVIGLILVVLWFVLLGYLIERGLLPEGCWPFQKRIDLLNLAISAACLTACLAMAIVFLRNNRSAVLVMGAMDVVLLGAGLFFMRKLSSSGSRAEKRRDDLRHPYYRSSSEEHNSQRD